MSKEQRPFQGIWIPAYILMHEGLTSFMKLLYADINSFSENKKYMYKSNQTIAKLYGVSVKTVTRAVDHLQKENLISVEYDENNARRMCSIGSVKMSIPYGQSDHTLWSKSPDPMVKMSHKNNNRDNTLENKRETKVELPFLGDNFGFAWEEWKREKKEQRQKYSARAQKMALKRLVDLSQGDEQKAIAIINQSLANTWKAFYPLRENKNNGFNTENFTPEGVSNFIVEG